MISKQVGLSHSGLPEKHDHLITLSALANTFGGIVRPVECNSTTPVNVLGWVDNSANENGFVIERKAGAGGTYAVLATVGPGTISYTDKTGVFGATYFYRVKATNTFGDSTYIIATRYRFHD
jgi:hypothetical protein